MDVVVVESEAYQHRVQTERTLEVGDNRNRSARAHQDSFLAPLLAQCALGGGKRLHVPVKRHRGRAGMIAEFSLAIARQPRGDIVAKGLSDLVGLLPLH